MIGEKNESFSRLYFVDGQHKKIAEAIFDAVDAEKEIKKIDEVIDIKTYDLIFAGFPTHGFGQMADEAKDFIEKYCAGKKIALFATHSAPEDSPFVPPWIKNYKKAASGTDLIGLADFQGQIALDQVDLMLQQAKVSLLSSISRERHTDTMRAVALILSFLFLFFDFILLYFSRRIISYPIEYFLNSTAYLLPPHPV